MAPKQLLHLVFGGELASLKGTTFKDVSKLDVVGIYPNYAAAHAAWQAAARATVDNARMRYFIVHIHRLLDPETAPDAEDLAAAARRARPTRPAAPSRRARTR